MKKIIIPLYVLLVLFLISLVFALTTITSNNIKSIQGAEEVVFPVYLDNEEEVVGFQVDINYSTSDLILIGIEPTSRINNATIVFNNQPPLIKIAVLVNSSTAKILPGNDPVLNLIFDVNDSAQTGNYNIILDKLIAADISAIALNVTEIDGLFEIVDPYGFVFLPPISNFENFTLQEGATLPLKFNVTNTTGFAVDDSVLVRVYNISLGIDHVYNASGSGSDFIDIDESSEMYKINIHTGQLNMTEGTYNIDVTFDNYQLESIGFELVDKSQGIGKGKQK